MNWDTLRNGAYHIDGSWRDIYVLDATREDWRKWIDFVNNNYVITFIAENYNDGIVATKIDSKFIDNRWDAERYAACASVFINEVQINCHFFTETVMEYDIDPSQIKSIVEHDKLMEYMKGISKLLGKEVILTEENVYEAVWLKVNKDAIQFAR